MFRKFLFFVLFVSFFSCTEPVFAAVWTDSYDTCSVGVLAYNRCLEHWTGSSDSPAKIVGTSYRGDVAPHNGSRMLQMTYDNHRSRMFFDASKKGYMDFYVSFAVPHQYYPQWAQYTLFFAYNHNFGTNTYNNLAGRLTFYRHTDVFYVDSYYSTCPACYVRTQKNDYVTGDWMYIAVGWDFSSDNAADHWIRYNIGGVWLDKMYNPYGDTRSVHGIGAVMTGSTSYDSYSWAMFLDDVNYYPNYVINPIASGLRFVTPADGSVSYFTDWEVEINAPQYDYGEIKVCYGETPSNANNCDQYIDSLVLSECDEVETTFYGRKLIERSEALDDGVNYYAKAYFIAGSGYAGGICDTSVRVSAFTTFHNTNNPLYLEKPWWDKLVDAVSDFSFDFDFDLAGALASVFVPTGGFSAALSGAFDEIQDVAALQVPFCYMTEFKNRFDALSFGEGSGYLVSMDLSVPVGSMGFYPLEIEMMDITPGSYFRGIFDIARPWINMFLWLGFSFMLFRFGWKFIRDVL